jgi:serine/threonine protein kinase
MSSESPIPVAPEVGNETSDFTLVATDMSDSQAPRSPDLDSTLCADPVEQAILIDRTRQSRGSRPGSAPFASCPPPGGEPRFAVASPSPSIAPPAETVTGETGSQSSSGVLAARPGEDLLGNYRIVAPLAAGGMGILYLGEHRFLGYRVAIKILQPNLRGDAEVERRFFAEALATSRIAHPGVPTVLDFGHDRRGTAYMVMEFLEGETLAAHLARRTAFSLEQVIDIGAQAAAILGAAHGKNILHRDIKPDNIFLSPDPDEPSGYRVKVLDFGVAKILADPPPNAEVTRHDFLVGTAWYMAPEQTFGPRGNDGRCDVYALGCVMFQLLTGRLPFMGEFEAVVQARRYQEPPSARQFRPDLPRSVDALVNRMLAREPKDRIASMTDLERELRMLLLGGNLRVEPVLGPNPTSPALERVRRVLHRIVRRARQELERAWRALDRQPRWVIAVGAAAVLLCVLALVLALS